jgi:hypothetical protein
LKNNSLLIIILIIVVGAAGFFGGMKYQQSKQLSRFNRQPFEQMRREGRGTGPAAASQPGKGPGMMKGEIIDKEGENLTVKLTDNSTKIILLSENTTINKTSEGLVDDLEVGKQVMVFGQENEDGSLSASNIQLGDGFFPKNQ